MGGITALPEGEGQKTSNKKEQMNMPKFKSYIQKLCNRYVFARRQIYTAITTENPENQLNEIRKEFFETVSLIREEVNNTFTNKRINVEEVDLGGIALITNNILTDEEIFDLAKQYKDNYTMTIVIARTLKNSGCEHLRVLSNNILNEISNRYIEVYDKAVRAIEKDLEDIEKERKKTDFVVKKKAILKMADDAEEDNNCCQDSNDNRRKTGIDEWISVNDRLPDEAETEVLR